MTPAEKKTKHLQQQIETIKNELKTAQLAKVVLGQK